MKAMFDLSVFKILLFEVRSVLLPAQRVAGSERINLQSFDLFFSRTHWLRFSSRFVDYYKINSDRISSRSPSFASNTLIISLIILSLSWIFRWKFLFENLSNTLYQWQFFRKFRCRINFQCLVTFCNNFELNYSS